MDAQDIDITALASDPSIVAAGSRMTQFAITGQHGRATDNFSSFADFEAALAMDPDCPCPLGEPSQAPRFFSAPSGSDRFKSERDHHRGDQQCK